MTQYVLSTFDDAWCMCTNSNSTVLLYSNLLPLCHRSVLCSFSCDSNCVEHHLSQETRVAIDLWLVSQLATRRVPCYISPQVSFFSILRSRPFRYLAIECETNLSHNCLSHINCSLRTFIQSKVWCFHFIGCLVKVITVLHLLATSRAMVDPGRLMLSKVSRTRSSIRHGDYYSCCFKTWRQPNLCLLSLTLSDTSCSAVLCQLCWHKLLTWERQMYVSEREFFICSTSFMSFTWHWFINFIQPAKVALLWRRAQKFAAEMHRKKKKWTWIPRR